MTFSLENVPDEPPTEVEQIVSLEVGEAERINELPVMLKAERLFSMPDAEDDRRYRSPDFVEQYTEISEERMSFLRDKSGRRLAYRRLINVDTKEVFKSTQVIEYCEYGTAVPLVITADRFPDGEIPADELKMVEDFLDDHERRISGEL